MAATAAVAAGWKKMRDDKVGLVWKMLRLSMGNGCYYADWANGYRALLLVLAELEIELN